MCHAMKTCLIKLQANNTCLIKCHAKKMCLIKQHYTKTHGVEYSSIYS
jgi:hypothetical protein